MKSTEIPKHWHTMLVMLQDGLPLEQAALRAFEEGIEGYRRRVALPERSL